MRQKAYNYSYELKIKRNKKITRNLLICLFTAVFLIILFKKVIFPVVVRSSTMEPNVESPAFMFFTPSLKNLDRGDIVLIAPLFDKEVNVFHKAIDVVGLFVTAQQVEPFKFSTQVTGKNCVRRLVGMPGDSIYMRDYILYVKPQGQPTFLSEYELSSTEYQLVIERVPQGMNELGIAGNLSEFQLGPDEYFVLADQRVDSMDSRVWGPVMQKSIEGRAILKYYPFKSFRLY